MKYTKMKCISYNLLHLTDVCKHLIDVLPKAFKTNYVEINNLDHIKNK